MAASDDDTAQRPWSLARSLGKLVITLVLGWLALVALLWTTCGVLSAAGGASFGAALGGALLLAATLYALRRLYR